MRGGVALIRRAAARWWFTVKIQVKRRHAVALVQEINEEDAADIKKPFPSVSVVQSRKQFPR